MLPLWFRANSGLSWPLLGGPLRLPTATARAVRRGLGFDAPAVVSHEVRCVSMLPLWCRANSVAFRCSPCGFARIPASRGLFRPLLGGPLRLLTATARAAVGRGLGFDAPAVVSREFRSVSMLPLWFRATSVAFRCSRCGFARIPALVASSGLFWGGLLRLPTATARAVGRVLGFDAPAVVSREFRCVSMLPLRFRANSVAFRCSRCGFARIPASWPVQASSGGAT